MKVPRMRAISVINFNSGAVRATGELDRDGQPIFESIPVIVRPGEFFTPKSAEDAAWLVEARACRPAVGGEEKLARDLAANDPDAEEPLDPPMWTRPGPAMPNSIDPIDDDEAGDDGRDLL